MTPAATRTRPRLKERYDTTTGASSRPQLGLANTMEVPRLEKIVINMGVGKATQQPSLHRGGGEGPGGDQRPEAGGHPGP